MITLSDFLLRHGWTVLIGFALLVVGFSVALRWAPIRLVFDRLLLKVPILGRISQSYYMANLARTLGLLLKSEVMIVEAVAITANTLTNRAYQRELRQISENLRRGERISAHMMRREHLFPPMLSQMVTVGESTGNLSETLTYLSELYENEVEESTKSLTSLIEPVLMVFMGVIVGFIAISIITPIYGITQNLQP